MNDQPTGAHVSGAAPVARAARTQRRTAIQARNAARILDAALEVFSAAGFHGATVDQIAERAGMSKPNLLYYFAGKEDIHAALIDRLLETWLDPLRALDPEGEPLEELRGYLRRKIEMAQALPRESRLFAHEVIQGAPRIADQLSGPLRELVEEKAAVIEGWIAAGRLARVDPRHLIFAIWATTQHYADFDAQVRAVLGGDDAARFDAAAATLETIFVEGLRPR
ncbi:MAG: TetR family transcriptional regulator C-terminal domain-containing protein [Rubrimonas sp.]